MSVLAIFDFCGTLIEEQSAALFINFLYDKQFWLKRKYLYFRARFCPYKSNQSVLYKNFLLKPFAGLTKSELEIYAQSFVTNILIPRLKTSVMERMLWHQKQHHYVVIVSGGFDIYLDMFAKHFKINEVIATRLAFEHDRFLGEIVTPECLGEQKVIRLKLSQTKFDFKNSYAYSDHVSDLPILSLVGNSYWVKNGELMKMNHV